MIGCIPVCLSSECPDLEELKHPNVTLTVPSQFAKYHIENTTCDIESYKREVAVSIKSTIPQAVPVAKAVFQIEIGGRIERFYCQGLNGSDSTCEKELKLTRYGTNNITVWLEHPGYANETEPIIFDCQFNQKSMYSIYIRDIYKRIT